MRKRILVGGAAILVIAAAAAPVISGRIVRSGFADFRSRVTTQARIVGAWRVISHDWGYLHSTAATRITLSLPQDDATFSLVLDHRIDHFPTAGFNLARLHSEPRIPDNDLAGLASRLYGTRRAPLTVDVTVGFTGTKSILVQSPPAEGTEILSAGRIEWQGFQAHITLGPNGERMRYRANSRGLRIETHASRRGMVYVGPVALHGHFAESRFDDIWTGSGSGHVSRLVMHAPGQGGLSLTHLAYSNTTRLKQELVHFSGRASMEELATAKYTIRNFRIHVSAERLAPAFVQRMQQAMETASRTGGDAPGGTLVRQLQRIPWGEVASHEPVIRLDKLRATTPTGTLSITAEVGLRAPRDPARRIGLGGLARLAHGTITVEVPKAIALDLLASTIERRTDASTRAAREQAKRTLRNLEQQGMLEIGDGMVRSSAAYRGGRITVNGHLLFAAAG